LRRTSFGKLDVLGHFPNIKNRFIKLSPIRYKWCFNRIKYISSDQSSQKKRFRKFRLIPKYTKRKIKSGWTGCCSLKRSLIRLSDQVPLAFWARSLGARLQLAQTNFVQKQHSHSLRALLTARSSELCPEAIWALSLGARWHVA